jgi:formiminotetrahydrofolate cyclodeaminase
MLSPLPHNPAGARSAHNDLVPRLDQISNRLLELSQHDIEAYRGVIDARKAGASPEDMARAYQRAAEVPLASAEVAAEGLELAVEVSKRAWEMTSSDLAVGNDLLQSGLSGALGNVEVNLPDLKGDTAARIERRYQELRSRSAR